MMKNKSPILSHQGQLQVWRDLRRFKVLVCGRRWGKTFFAGEWLLAASNKPRQQLAYVAPTRQQSKDILWEHLIQRCHQLGWTITSNVSELKITRKNGSVIQLFTAEKEKRFRGRKFHKIVLDEYAEYNSKTIWTQAIRPTLADYRGEAIFIFTPRGFNSAYDIFQYAQEHEDDWGVYNFKTIDSPFFQTPEGKKELESAREMLSPRDYEQEFEATFVSDAGRVYYSFDKNKHSLDYVPDSSQPIYVGMDFNVNPMTAVIGQYFNNNFFIFDELYLRNSNSYEMRDMLYNKFGRCIIYPDSTGKARKTSAVLTDHEILREKHVVEYTRNPQVKDRYNCVNGHFFNKRIMIHPRCKYLIKDLQHFTTENKDSMLGHISDALGYFVWAVAPLIQPIPKARVEYYA